MQQSKVTSSNIAYFSESRIRDLCHLLGHDNLRGLIERVAATVNKRRAEAQALTPALNPPNHVSPIDLDVSRKYIEAYFEYIHPLYPFINRDSFEEKALASGVTEYLEADRVFSVLYYAVLALGCQYAGDRSFAPATSSSRQLFDLAKRYLPDILLTKATLKHLQVFHPQIWTFRLDTARLQDTLGNHCDGRADSDCDESSIINLRLGNIYSQCRLYPKRNSHT